MNDISYNEDAAAALLITRNVRGRALCCIYLFYGRYVVNLSMIMIIWIIFLMGTKSMNTQLDTWSIKLFSIGLFITIK